MHPVSYCHSTSSRNSRNDKTWSSAHQPNESGFAGSMQHRVRSKDNGLQLINTTNNYPVSWEHFPTEQLRRAHLQPPSASAPDEQKPTFNENDPQKKAYNIIHICDVGTDAAEETQVTGLHVKQRRHSSLHRSQRAIDIHK